MKALETTGDPTAWRCGGVNLPQLNQRYDCFLRGAHASPGLRPSLAKPFPSMKVAPPLLCSPERIAER